MVGVRDIQLENEFKVTGDVQVNPPTTPPTFTTVTRTYESEPEATDTIIMLRPSIQITENWRFNPTMSYAVDGDSEDHYELSPQFQYQFSDYFALRIGYRSLSYDIGKATRAATTTAASTATSAA